MQSEDKIIKIGKPYLPYLRISDNGLFRISKRMKGFHKESVVINLITHKKIEAVLQSFLKKGATIVSYSTTTKSVYLKFDGKDYRISDHKSQFFSGETILIKWDTDIEPIITTH